jgi:hypothetical protein
MKTSMPLLVATFVAAMIVSLVLPDIAGAQRPAANPAVAQASLGTLAASR